MSTTEPTGVHCGGVNCEGRHPLPEPWDETQRRSQRGEPCITKGTARPTRRRLHLRTDPDEHAANPYGEDGHYRPLDW